MNTKVATLRRWRILSAFLISEMRMALKLIDVVPDVNGFLVPAMGWQPIRVDYLNSQIATKITKLYVLSRQVALIQVMQIPRA